MIVLNLGGRRSGESSRSGWCLTSTAQAVDLLGELLILVLTGGTCSCLLAFIQLLD